MYETNNRLAVIENSSELQSQWAKYQKKFPYAKDITYQETVNCYDYSDEELAQFIPIIKAADREGKKVQVYFNNHPNGSGAKNAISLKKMIEMLSLA